MAENGSSGSGSPAASTPTTTVGASAARPQGRASTLFRAIQFAFALLVVLLAALAGYYYFYATRQQEYLAARNVRALVRMSSQVDGSLTAADQVLRNLDAASSRANLVPMLEHLAVRPAGDDTAMSMAGPLLKRGACAELVKDAPSTSAKVTQWALPVDAADGTCLARTFEYGKPGAFQLGFALLSPRTLFDWIISDPVERRIVESAMVVDTSGLVLAQSGVSELGIRRLDQLIASAIVLPKTKGTPPPAPTWAGVRSNSSRVSILIAGQQYELFVQPCCHRGTALVDRGLVVAAIVRSSTLQRKSLQFSYSLVALILAILVLASTTTPFLKFQLVGPLQRIRPTDVVLLALCSILCASLTTVVVLDLYAYAKLRRGLDRQLVQLGDAVSTHLGREVRLVHNELLGLVDWQRETTDAGPGTDLLRYRAHSAFTYPFFESWTMVDSNGMQTKKWSFDKATQKLLPVRSRRYFQDVLNGAPLSIGQLTSSPTPDTLFALESVQSMATGKRQAVLSIPTPRNADSGRTAPKLPVSAITVDLASVIDPVIAPNFMFAIVDSSGMVLFHSDKRRNLQENLFAETDQNRSVRSAVFARTSVSVGVTYSGDDYMAYVRPVNGLPWSVVTLRDQNAIRVINLETVATTVVLVVLHAMLMVMLGLAYQLTRRTRRLSWIWPDRERGEDYIRLAGTYVALLLAFALALAFLHGSALLSASALLPLEGVLLTWAVLRLSPSEWKNGDTRTWRRQRQWPLAGGALVLLAVASISAENRVGANIIVMAITLLAIVATTIALGPRATVTRILERPVRQWPTSRRYRLGVTLLLTLVCVLPAAGFFQVVYRLQTQAFVRHGQLRVAMALEARRRRLTQTYSDARGFNKAALLPRRLCVPLVITSGDTPVDEGCGLDLYPDIFYGTHFTTDIVTPLSDSANVEAQLASLREPYEPENSVERRPLLRQSAVDNSWKATVKGGDAALSYTPLGRGSTITLHSDLPALAPSSTSDVVKLVLMLLALPALAWATAAFVSRRLFLLDQLDARAFGELTPHEQMERSVVVICRTTAELDKMRAAKNVLEVDMTQLRAQWKADVLRHETGQPVRVIFPVVTAASAAHAAHESRLVALERLLFSGHALVTVLVLRVGTEAPLRDRLELLGNPHDSSQGRERLARLMENFVVIDSMRTSGAPDAPRPNHITSAPAELAESALKAEQSGDPFLQSLWETETYGRDEDVLDRLGERAEAYYDSIWATSSRKERAVMVHLAEDGYVNSKDHELLRRLLTRGLVRRTPRIALLNETFRRFVLHRGAAEEAIAERKRELSVWDGVRTPIIVLIVGVLAFFLVTQQEFFNSATAVMAGVVTGLPAFARLASWIGERRSAA